MNAPRLDQGSQEGQLRVSGALTFETVPELHASSGSLLAGKPTLEIDLAGVDRVDSAGLALLTEWARAARAARQEIRFINVPAQMRDLLRVSGLDDVLPFGRPTV